LLLLLLGISTGGGAIGGLLEAAVWMAIGQVLVLMMMLLLSSLEKWRKLPMPLKKYDKRLKWESRRLE
jgi:hypothetical protein